MYIKLDLEDINFLLFCMRGFVGAWKSGSESEGTATELEQIRRIKTNSSRNGREEKVNKFFDVSSN